MRTHFVGNLSLIVSHRLNPVTVALRVTKEVFMSLNRLCEYSPGDQDSLTRPERVYIVQP